MNFEDIFEFLKTIFRVIETLKYRTIELRVWSKSTKKVKKDEVQEVLLDLMEDLAYIAFSLEKFSLLSETQDEVKEFIKTFKNILDAQDKKVALDTVIDNLDWLEARFVVWIDRIRTQFRDMSFVLLSPNTSLNLKKLINGPKSFLNDTVWDKLSDLQKGDLEDGCRCISLQAWTPAAMILLRVVEAVLRFYYQKITGNEPLKKNWGRLLQELNGKVNTSLLKYFDYLKDMRNQLQHPETRFTQTEAEEAFIHVTHVLNQIYS